MPHFQSNLLVQEIQQHSNYITATTREAVERCLFLFPDGAYVFSSIDPSGLFRVSIRRLANSNKPKNNTIEHFTLKIKGDSIKVAALDGSNELFTTDNITSIDFLLYKIKK